LRHSIQIVIVWLSTFPSLKEIVNGALSTSSKKWFTWILSHLVQIPTSDSDMYVVREPMIFSSSEIQFFYINFCFSSLHYCFWETQRFLLGTLQIRRKNVSIYKSIWVAWTDLIQPSGIKVQFK
jgi:hypothetical protein